MIDRQTRAAILALKTKGHGIREIARAMEVSRNSVREVVADGGVQPAGARRASVFDEHLESIRLYHGECRGNMVRVMEKLQDELAGRGRKIEASYSALTRFCRETGIGVEAKVPVGRIVTGPGEEMQHDMSTRTVDKHVESLRKKLPVFGAHVETVIGMGPSSAPDRACRRDSC